MTRSFSIPAALEQLISERLQYKYQLSLQDASKLADAVKKLSDYFIQNPDGQTPWHERWAQIAYLCYFLPLNHARVQAVVTEAKKQNFFAGLSEVVDFGCGPGTASLALIEDFKNFTLVEKAKDICAEFAFIAPEISRWATTPPPSEAPDKTLAVFSYSLTELENFPAWTKKLEALMILEPSTQEDGRKLAALRHQLLLDGYNIWAPCTHQGQCPLLTQSKTDWCHDRIFFTMPPWFEALEQHLPMKNRTLTMSYLLARRKKAGERNFKTGRTVGDQLHEKGKDRQLFCRGEDREFLAWMHKQGPPQEIPRGVLLELPEDVQKVSNELRLKSPARLLI